MMAIHKIVLNFVGFIWPWLSGRQLSVGQHVEKEKKKKERRKKNAGSCIVSCISRKLNKFQYME